MNDKPEKIVSGETGAQRALGYSNHVYADRTETRMTLDERHSNRHGTLHGGLATVLLDSACGFAASRALSEDTTQLVITLSFATNYLAPGRGPNVKAIGRVRRAGFNVVYCDGDLVDDDGTLIATGSGVFKAVRPNSSKGDV